MTSPCAEPREPHRPSRADEHYRTSPRLLTRRLPRGMVVCVAGESVYQDVRVLRLDELAAAVVEAARCARSVTELEAAVALTVGNGNSDGFGELVDGLVAVRVLEHARG